MIGDEWMVGWNLVWCMRRDVVGFDAVVDVVFPPSPERQEDLYM